MGKRTALIGLGIVGIVLGGGAWVLTRPKPAPAAPIDYKAELTKLALKGQPGDPSAENGWPELLAVGADLADIAARIERRERDADTQVLMSEVEPWSGNPFGGWGCKTQTARDERITAEVWQRVADERILERLGAALGHDVFIMDLDERLGAQLRTNWGNVQRSEVPSRVRTLSRMLTGLTERAMDAGNWEEALARMEDHVALVRIACVQPDAIWCLTGWGMRQSMEWMLTRRIIQGTVLPLEFLGRARDLIRSARTENLVALLEAQRLEARELIDVSTDLVRQGGAETAVIRTLQGWTSSAEARASVDAWSERVRAMTTADPRAIAAIVASINTGIDQVKGIHVLAVQSVATGARLVELAASQQRSADALDILIALAIFTSAHGSPPQTLDALEQEFLPELPKDPWAPDGQYRYIPGPTMGDIVLYSVGWDGEDNGGATMPFHFDIGLREEGKGYDYVFTCDRCEQAREQAQPVE